MYKKEEGPCVLIYFRAIKNEDWFKIQTASLFLPCFDNRQLCPYMCSSQGNFVLGSPLCSKVINMHDFS